MKGVLETCTGASTMAPGSAVPSSPVAASPRLWPHKLLVLGEVRGRQPSPAPSPAPSLRTVAGSSTHWVVEHRTCTVLSPCRPLLTSILTFMHPGLLLEASHLHSLQFSITVSPCFTSCPRYSHTGSEYYIEV